MASPDGIGDHKTGTRQCADNTLRWRNQPSKLSRAASAKAAALEAGKNPPLDHVVWSQI